MSGNVDYKIAVVSLFILCVFGCDYTFEPWQENDQYHFSIYGFLNVTADTQWIRVMPVREDLLSEPQVIDATVELEHLESGDTVVLNDSLFLFSHGAWAHNFWTTEDVYPEQSYRIKVERSDGAISYADVTLPKDFPAPSIEIQKNWVFPPPIMGEEQDPFQIIVTTKVYIHDVERLADVQTIFYSPDLNRDFSIPHMQDTLRLASSIMEVSLEPEYDFYKLLNDLKFRFPRGASPNGPRNYIETSDVRPRIFVAAGGPGYHHFGSMNIFVEPLPTAITNVVNGVGYVGGIISKTVPYKGCQREGTAILIPCPTEPYPF